MNKVINTKKLIGSISLIPESAPFDAQQRAWLNGFFAGMTGLEDVYSDSSDTDNANAAGVATEIAGEAVQQEEDFPWHDDSLLIDQRMELAADRPYERKLMAAMAQLDCGSCGYLCQTYAEAIASGAESNLTLCTPGGKETAKMVKKLVKLGGSESTSAAEAKPSEAETGYTRKNPFPAKLLKSEKLNGEGSAKDVRHVELDLTGSELNYEVGDALGLYPTNCDGLVKEILSLCETDDFDADARSLMTLDLSTASEEICELLIAAAADDTIKQQIRGLIDDEDQLDEMDVLDLLERFSAVSISSRQLIDTLSPLNPRLYSIASSLKAHPNQVHLTVGKVTYEKNDRIRKGVASTFLAERVDVGTPINVFVQKSHGFTIPADDTAPMIMVGPGTGIAPFVAFLQERSVRKSAGKNWLFFGDQRSSTDFLYQDQLIQWNEQGLLTKLDVAFSRDQDHKVYVQDRMKENAAELFQWLENGASFFVCGDAQRMARDVDSALHEIIAAEGNLSADQAKAYVKQLKDQNRYCRDVY